MHMGVAIVRCCCLGAPLWRVEALGFVLVTGFWESEKGWFGCRYKCARPKVTRMVGLQIHVCSPDGEKQSLKVRRSDDVATLRALVTQMYDSADWTQVP